MSAAGLKPIDQSQWDARKARHLLNRAGFGIPRERWERLARLDPEAAVSELVDYEMHFEPGAAPNFVPPVVTRAEYRERFSGMDQEEARRVRRKLRREQREAIERLKGWWLNRMLNTKRPLEEKLALFWHGHFAASAQKIQIATHNYEMNETFRRNASGNFKTLTIEVGQSPAMLRYLDNDRSTKRKPNENWARELMELFTMGQRNYTEDDIKNSARAFTGWSHDQRKFVYREDQHDFGDKTFMGRTGDFDGWDIVDIIFEQPATAEYIARELWIYFANENPNKRVVAGLADTLRNENYELKPMLRQMFLSRAFYEDDVIASQIKSPVQLIVQMSFDLGIESPPYRAMARATRELGQDLFYPPNVKGWDGNRAWINANALLFRYNLSGALIQASRKRPKENAMQDNATAPYEENMMQQRRETVTRWEPKQFLAQFEFGTANEFVDALCSHFLSAELSEEQRATLLAAVGAGRNRGVVVRPDTIPPRELMTVLHLLLSSAEYQLC